MRIVQFVTAFTDAEPLVPWGGNSRSNRRIDVGVLSIDDSFKKFGSRGNEETTATPVGKLGSREVFLKMRETTACLWVDGNDLVDTIQNNW